MTSRVFEVEVPLLAGRPLLTHNQRFGWRKVATRRRHIRTTVCLAARIARRAAGIPQADHITVQLHYRPPDRRKRDAPNLTASSKPAVDGLVDAGLVPDDTPEHVTEVMPQIHEPGQPPRMWLTIEITKETQP